MKNKFGIWRWSWGWNWRICVVIWLDECISWLNLFVCMIVIRRWLSGLWSWRRRGRRWGRSWIILRIMLSRIFRLLRSGRRCMMIWWGRRRGWWRSWKRGGGSWRVLRNRLLSWRGRGGSWWGCCRMWRWIFRGWWRRGRLSL